MNFYLWITCYIYLLCVNESKTKKTENPSIYLRINELVKKLSPLREKNAAQVKGLFGNFKPDSLSVLMNFNLDGTSSFNLIDTDKGVYWSDIGNCAHGQIFDALNAVCRDIFCKEGFYLTENDCSSNKTSVKRNQSSLYEMKIEFNLNFRVCHFKKNSSEENECYSQINEFQLNESLIETLISLLAKQLNINSDRISNFTVYSNMSLEEDYFKNMFIFSNISNEFNETMVGIQRFTVSFKVFSKEHDLEDATKVYFSMNLFSASKYLFVMNETKVFTISNVMNIQESNMINDINEWCEKDKSHDYFMNGFRILIERNNGKYTPNSHYFIYIEQTKKLYATGQYHMSIIYDPIKNRTQLMPLNPFESNECNSVIAENYIWTEDPDFLDVTDYVLEKGSTEIEAISYVSVCDREPRIRTGCDNGTLVLFKKCEFYHRKARNEYCPKWSGGSKCLSINEYEEDQKSPQTHIRICLDSIITNLKNFSSNNKSSLPFNNDETDDLDEINQITSWLSFISIIISIIFLIITLVTYMLFEKLRTLPAWIVINLTLALFVAQSSFCLGSLIYSERLACFLVSILTHYGYLAAFFWMNVSAFDLHRNFKQNSSHVILSMVTLKERLPKYLAYGWLSPLLIVITCLSIDFSVTFSNKYSLKPCYAGYLEGCSNVIDTNPQEQCLKRHKNYIFIQSCYIQNGRANLFFFGIPIAIIIGVNAVFYFLTIFNIRKMKSKQKKGNLRMYSKGKVASDADVKFYIQMAFIMGFTWIAGFISASYEEDGVEKLVFYQIFVFLFIISNATIGLFIFGAFLFRADVIKLYRNLVNEKVFKKKNEPASKIYSIQMSQTKKSTITENQSTSR